MYMNQSAQALNHCLNQQNQPTLSAAEMQLLTRRVVMNLTKSALQTKTKMLQPVAAKINDAHSKNYAAVRPKQKLLRFPAFPLKETLDKFIKSAEPLLDECELQQTKEATEKFLECDGAKLQELLEAAAKCEENWLATRWQRTAYMQYRDPVTVYSSPGMTFPMQKFNSDNEYRAYTGKVICGLIKYKQMIDCGEIPVVKMGKLELDNSQFERVFGTCRIPQPKEDTLEFHDSLYVVVIYKNHFYKVNVYAKNGKAVHPDAIAFELMKIMKAENLKGPAIGLLSSDTRDNWATSYAELLSIDGNCEAVKTIQKSLFTVSLDDEVPFVEGIDELNVQGVQLIHGGGSQQNSGNRWFDKTIQVIVNRNGMSGFCYEHSPAEGQPIALMTDYVIKILNDPKLNEGTTLEGYECSSKLCLASSPCLDSLIEKSKQTVNKLASDLNLNVLVFKNYGKGFLKKQKLSPDSFIQMALQYGFYKLHKMPGAHYESAHLRIYANGRTETIRSCSNESIAFARAMLDECCSDEKRVELLRTAVKGHREYTNMALQGRGVDRHLLGLKLMAMENKLPIPDFYKSPGYVKSANFRLSTSQVASVNEAFMCYGPLTHDGYACCYNPREKDMILALSAWRSNTETNVDKFAVAMREALDSMKQLLERAGEKPTAKL